MKKEPMELLKQFASEFAENQGAQKKMLFENKNYSSIPNKYKYLIGIAAGAAMNSSTCTKKWTKMALENGISNDEIVEAMMIARLLKQGGVNDTISETLSYLDEQ